MICTSLLIVNCPCQEILWWGGGGGTDWALALPEWVSCFLMSDSRFRAGAELFHDLQRSPLQTLVSSNMVVSVLSLLGNTLSSLVMLVLSSKFSMLASNIYDSSAINADRPFASLQVWQSSIMPLARCVNTLICTVDWADLKSTMSS